MRRLGQDEATGALVWLRDRPEEEFVTGLDPSGWRDEVWILHAMYENRDLEGSGTHHDLHRRLEEGMTVTGVPLGYVARPSETWQRILWTDYLGRSPDFVPNRDYPPCIQWFPRSSWPLSIEAPPEGSLDEESLNALIAVIAEFSSAGRATECVAFYGSLPAGGDFDSLHLWEGHLGDLPSLIGDLGGTYGLSPTNFWPVNREWFVWTDYDLQATKVSGPQPLIAALRSTSALECIDWPAHRDA